MRLVKAIRKHPLLVAFLLPIIIMAIYFFAVRHVYPFGNGSLLTVDLGQQYIDFYAYFRQTLLGHPGQLFYAWNNALGGDAFGTWAYYLISPFNLVLCLLPKAQLDLGITIITLLKYGSASWTMAYYLKHHNVNGGLLPTFGLAYALSGWMIANQLNLIWFDGAIILPLICLGIDQLHGARPKTYVLWLAIALITNYYTGYMLCLFVIGYFGFTLCEQTQTWRLLRTSLLRFAGGSLLAGALAAVVLLPTFFQLTQSKGTYTVTHITAKFEYNPLHLLSKFFSGTFNFDQMPSGLPNVFVGAIAVLAAVLYFTSRKIRWQERLAALIWTVFLGMSLMFEPLDLLWHGMQFPVWYPYRFSFIVCFWLILLAARYIQAEPRGANLIQLALLLAIVASAGAYVWLHKKSFSFLTSRTIIFSIVLGLMAVVLLSLPRRREFRALVLAFTIIDATASSVLALNQISYVSHSDYHSYTTTLSAGVSKIQKQDTGFYRIGKTILRTKNDAMQVGYVGEDQFTSMMPPALPKFFSEIGQPEGDGFVTYANGTILLDAILNTKYWLNLQPQNNNDLKGKLLPTLSPRPDLATYHSFGHTDLLAIRRNQNALGFGFAASDQILKTKLNSGSPIANQELMLAGLEGTGYKSMFSVVPFTHTTLTNLQEVKGSSMVYKMRGKHKVGSVEYQFTVPTSEPLYLTVGGDFTDNAVTITQNGKQIKTYDTFRNQVMLNVTPTDTKTVQTLKFTFSKQIDFGQVTLYQLNEQSALRSIKQLAKSKLHVTSFHSNSLNGTININQPGQVLFTTIPWAKGWHVKIDGKTATPKKTLGLFMAFKLSRGKHTISMVYYPPYLGVGLAISLVAAALAWLWLHKRREYRHAAPMSRRLRLQMRRGRN
ncbi:YfhO family protein [Lacticaseibacillus hulanensis]|uniref:YfhO family protein n=1 Tax=Lacticaseibacillus hulanensis TaxID=2493111 RepID=UPI000FD6C8AB|nr:YfhO family protein [Lacticaseibacillus hulanensis]